MRGWRGYFGFCETPVVLDYLTRWARLRLRAALWRQWKTLARRAALLALGVRQHLASNTAGSGRGPWYLAKSKALSVGLSKPTSNRSDFRCSSMGTSATNSNRRVRTRTHGGVAGCVKKTCKRHAVRKMKVGPSKSSCRRGLQTAVSCFSQKLWW